MVNPKDVKALTTAMEGLLNDDELRRKFRVNCRKRAVEDYSIEKFQDRYIKLYEKILGGLRQ